MTIWREYELFRLCKRLHKEAKPFLLQNYIEKFFFNSVKLSSIWFAVCVGTPVINDKSSYESVLPPYFATLRASFTASVNKSP